MVTDACSRILDDYIPKYDSDIVRILQNNFLLLGNTNMDEFAMGSSTYSEKFGQTLNPINKNYAIGGSSGGSAAALFHSGLFSLGSDTGGSVRLPASLTNTLGFKPTRGVISRFGLISFSNSIETIGIFTKNEIKTIVQILNLIELNNEWKDDTVIKLKRENRNLDKVKFKILIPTSIFLKKYCDHDVYQDFVFFLNDITAKYDNIKIFESIELDKIMIYLLDFYFQFSSLEAYSNLLRYDNTIFPCFNLQKKTLKFSDFDQYRSKVRDTNLGKNVINRLNIAKKIIKEQKVNDIVKQYWNIKKQISLLDFDFIFTPGSIKKFFIDRTTYEADILYPLANIGNLPAMVFHNKVKDKTIPLQIIGKHGQDWTIIKWIEKYVNLKKNNDEK